MAGSPGSRRSTAATGWRRSRASSAPRSAPTGRRRDGGRSHQQKAARVAGGENAMDWLTAYKIPLGSWIKTLVDLLNAHASGFFDFISWALGGLINGITEVLIAIPAPLLIVLVALLAWFLHRSWQLVALVVISLLLIINLGYWRETLETLALVVSATAMCMVIGIPVGIMAAHHPRFYTVLRPVLDLMQTI